MKKSLRKKRENNLNNSRFKTRCYMVRWAAIAMAFCLLPTNASATAVDGKPLTIVNNLSSFIFSCIKAVGIIILGQGVKGMQTKSWTDFRSIQEILKGSYRPKRA